jgi:hypothetical protein
MLLVCLILTARASHTSDLLFTRIDVTRVSTYWLEVVCRTAKIKLHGSLSSASALILCVCVCVCVCVRSRAFLLSGHYSIHLDLVRFSDYCFTLYLSRGT